MNREIKFRQRVKGRWHYWGHLEPDSFTSPRDIRTPSEQFTGLHDANGREIYEGDVVSTGAHGAATAVVYWRQDGIGGFCLQSSFSPDTMYDTSRIEVIGNIHEHPELIPCGL